MNDTASHLAALHDLDDVSFDHVSGPDVPISPKAYQWTGRFMRFLRHVLKVNVKLHHDAGQVEAGDIFVFNHFARFETFIPQYLFWEHCGAMCRSVADHALFRAGDRFSNYLQAVGAVPNNHPHLLAYLAAEILRGRKLIVFPEGGMVKDRQVLDSEGQYSIYSRSAQQRRKQHSGAAVIALALEVFKQAVIRAYERGDKRRLDSWCQLLGVASHDLLLRRAERPTLIVPANITFYPMRVQGNILQQGVEFFNRGISPRMREELLIEGNLLLRDTDMDIRLGDPMRAAHFWSERERRVVSLRAAKLSGLSDALTTHAARADKRLYANATRLQAERIRDAYMHSMYQLVSVNLAHLASLAIYRLLEADRADILVSEFRKIVYLAIEKLRGHAGVHMHRSLRNPESFVDLTQGRSSGLEQFIRTTIDLGLIEHADAYYRFLPKLMKDHDFDRVRLENPVEVYVNEVAPIGAARMAVEQAIAEVSALSEQDIALLRFEDERRALHWDRARFAKPKHHRINATQTQTESAEPFFFRPEEARRTGVLLVHGFLAGPAEVRGFGEALRDRGFVTLGVRLKGHGTSPWDLRSRQWLDWLANVRRGYEMLLPFVDRVCLVGFSAGGSVCLQFAAEQPAHVSGTVAISAPMKFKNKNMALIPFVHRTNRLVSMVRERGVIAFRPNYPEHPNLNYAHMPIHALFELGRLVESLKKNLKHVRCPTLILQGDQDPVVEPESGPMLFRALGAQDKTLRSIASARHGILYQNVGDTWAHTIDFIEQHDRQNADDGAAR